MPKNMKNRIPFSPLLAIASIIMFCILPLIAGESGLSLVAEMLIMALAAAALNILLGDCGIVSFGHAGFFAVGAYTFGLLLYYHLANFWLAFILAMLVVVLYSVIIGWFVVRLVHIYFALLCLAFAQVIWVVVSVWYSVTGGDDGLNGVPVIHALYPTTTAYYFILAVAGICFFVLYLIRQSPFGRSLHALRDNRTRAGFIGINTRQYIYIAFIISGLFCGIAGILLVVLLHCAFPGYAHFIKSGDFLFVCLLGGMYNFSGPIVGAFLFMFLHFIISRYMEYWPLVMGLGTLLIALFFRGGVTGFITERYHAYRIRKRTE
jgi:branched-chain amino acid transport system permease protein